MVLKMVSVFGSLFLLLAFPTSSTRTRTFSRAVNAPRLSSVRCVRRPLQARAGHAELAGKIDRNSFVQNDMRKAAMKLHTKDQSKEGEQEEQRPLSQWEMSKEATLRFLVDSKVIHSTLDEISASYPELSELNEASMEIRRCDNIERDIDRILNENPELRRPEPNEGVLEYAENLKKLAADSVPAFVCHYYNTHFAHAAGGRMIGKLIADKNFNGETLNFYKYNGNPKELLENVRKQIDKLASTWQENERESCLAETANAFKGAGVVLQNLK